MLLGPMNRWQKRSWALVGIVTPGRRRAGMGLEIVEFFRGKSGQAGIALNVGMGNRWLRRPSDVMLYVPPMSMGHIWSYDERRVDHARFALLPLEKSMDE